MNDIGSYVFHCHRELPSSQFKRDNFKFTVLNRRDDVTHATYTSIHKNTLPCLPLLCITRLVKLLAMHRPFLGPTLAYCLAMNCTSYNFKENHLNKTMHPFCLQSAPLFLFTWQLFGHYPNHTKDPTHFMYFCQPASKLQVGKPEKCLQTHRPNVWSRLLHPDD